jgi:hypothetical protein
MSSSSRFPKEGTEASREADIIAQVEIGPKSIDIQKRNRRSGIRRTVGDDG